MSETNLQFLGLFTGTAKEGTIEIYRGGSLFWKGFIDPDANHDDEIEDDRGEIDVHEPPFNR